MKTIWTSHIKDENERVRFENQVRNSKSVLERLSTILEAQEQGMDRIETGPALFQIPGWEGALAHYHGKRAAFRQIKDLINLQYTENE